MKTYNRLIRIKCNGKTFDIFEDENHKKVFLEVREIENVEKYFYLNIKDYIYLNKIYNCKDLSVLAENGQKNNKYKFAYIVGMSSYLGFVTFAGLYGLKLLPNIVFERTAQITSDIKDSRDDYDVISDISELDKYYPYTVSFDDLRNTLKNNTKINTHYHEYCNKFIDALERNLPYLDLTLFNEHLKDLEFIDVAEKDWKDDNTIGRYYYYQNVIKIREGCENDIYVIFHELVHCFRIGLLEPNNISLNVDYRIDDYGDTFNEAFTELVTDYLIADVGEAYFEDIEQMFLHYPEYATPLFQILKLVGDEYTLYDFFNHDVGRFKTVLEKYGLEDLIVLYDVDKESNLVRDIVIDDKSRIVELEGKILSLRIRQELENDANLSEVYKLANALNCQDSKKIFYEITNCVKEKNNWIYCYTDEANIGEYEKDFGDGLQTIKYLNPMVKILDGDNIVYDGSLCTTIDNDFINKLHVVMGINGNNIEYKLVLFDGNKYVDVVTNEEVKSNFITLSLNEFIGNDYNCEINLNQFLISDFVNSKMSDVNNKVNTLLNLVENNASEYEIYNKAKEFFPDNWLNICDEILKDDNWSYRLTEECDKINHQGLVYTNPKFEIYSNGELIIESSLHKEIDGKIVNIDFHIVPVIENCQIVYKLAKLDDGYFIDVLTNKQIDNLGIPMSLTNIIDSFMYDVRINLDLFLNSDLVESKLLEVNEKLVNELQMIKSLKDSEYTDYEIYEVLKQSFPDNWLKMANYAFEDKKTNNWDYRITREADILKFQTIAVDETGNQVIGEHEFPNPEFKIYYNDRVIYQGNLHKKENGKVFSSPLYLAITLENNELIYNVVGYQNGRYIDILTNDFVNPINCYSLIEVFELQTYDLEINLNNFLNSDLVKFKSEWMINDFEQTVNTLRDLKNNGASDYEIYNRAEDSYDYYDYVSVANLALSQIEKTNDNWTYRLTDKANIIKTVSSGFGTSQMTEYKVPNPSFKIYKNNEVIYEGLMYYLDDGKIYASQQLFVGMVTGELVDGFRLLKNYDNKYYVDFFTGEKVNSIMVMNLTSIIGESNYNFEINLDTFMQSDVLIEGFEINTFERQK